MLRSILALTLTALVALWLAPPAQADESGTAGTTWSIVPSDPAAPDEPDGRVSLRHEVEPGASVADSVLVTNHSETAADFVVQAGDGLLGEGGAFDISAEEPTASGSWISIDGIDADGALRLEAGESRALPVTVAVPEEATPGDHPAGIVIARTSGEGAVSVTHRVGVRLHLRVAGEITAQVEVNDVQTAYEGSLVPFARGTLRVSFEIVNTGNVRLGARAVAEAAGPLGLAAVEADALDVDELLPGDSVRVETELKVWPALRTSGDVVLDPRIVGEDAVADPGGDAEAYGAWTVPWTGLLLLALIGAGTWWRCRGRAAAKPASDMDSDTEGREPVDA